MSRLIAKEATVLVIDNNEIIKERGLRKPLCEEYITRLIQSNEIQDLESDLEGEVPTGPPITKVEI